MERPAERGVEADPGEGLTATPGAGPAALRLDEGHTALLGLRLGRSHTRSVARRHGGDLAPVAGCVFIGRMCGLRWLLPIIF